MNPRTPEDELPLFTEAPAEVPRIERQIPASSTELTQTARPDRAEARDAGEPVPPRSCEAPGAQSFLFDDPYWDEAFDSYHDPTLRTCCRS